MADETASFFLSALSQRESCRVNPLPLIPSPRGRGILYLLFIYPVFFWYYRIFYM